MAKAVAYEDLFWVGIGASAGGLEAIKRLTQALPSSSNLVYIVAQHLSPRHKSMMTELVQRDLQLKVQTVSDGIEVEPDTIYITPPQRDVRVEGNRLRLTPTADEPVPKPSINNLFVSLAEEKKDHAVGIILSGTGTDGAYGIKKIRACGGVTMVQDQETAQYDGMPRAAIDTGCVDFVLTVPQIGEQLIKVSSQLPEKTRRMLERADNKDSFLHLMKLIHEQCGISFKHYKKATLRRRIERRMLNRGITDFDDYVAFARENPDEVRLLFKDILISVTEFFRDPEPFECMASVIKDILAQKDGFSPIRFWTVGCATGEEAYSLAILLAEAVGGPERLMEKNFQIFATDVDVDALALARRGVYPHASVGHVPEKYLKKYFIKREQGYELIKPIKDVILFASHNVSEDPPFFRIDLITCRNLLIYMEPDLQKQIFSVFHYALQPQGYLFLGKSESVSQAAQLFHATHPKHKIFQRRSGVASDRSHLVFSSRTRQVQRTPPPRREENSDPLPQLHEALVRQLGEASVLINDNFDIQHIYGDATPYISLANGKPDMNLASIISEVHKQEVRALVFKALRSNTPAIGQVRKSRQDGAIYQERLKVYPLISAAEGERQAIVSFEKLGKLQFESHHGPLDASEEKVRELEAELAAAREHLQTVIEELETSNEELQSLNEELQSSNEELQSSNEELETTNEELQSANEELVTMNDELNTKTIALEQTTTQLTNVINSLRYPLIVLDKDSTIIRANVTAEEVFGFSGEGVCFNNVMPRQFVDGGVLSTVRAVMEHEQVETLQLQLNGRFYWLHATPFAPAARSSKGAVLSFIENTDFIEQQKELVESRKKAQAANIAKSEFLANVSHEIRTPLNAIYGVTEIFKLKMPDGEKRDQLMRVLQNSAANLKDLLDDLLDFAKLEAGQLKLEKVEFSLRELVEKLRGSYAMQASEKGIELVAQVEPGLPECLIGDPLRIHQVLANLLSNAVKFTEKGSVILEVTGEVSNAVLSLGFTIEDTGIGMTEAELNAVFEKFYQADTSISRRYGGTGLGLAIVKELVAIMHGDLRVSSKKEVGTRFTLTLPLQIAHEKVGRETAVDPLFPLFKDGDDSREYPILIVEDNRSNIFILTNYLDQLGCCYDVAESGEAGLERVKDRWYACILLDIQMEGVDGFQFFQRFRRELGQPGPARTRVIAVSGNVQSTIMEQALKAGMDDFLPKPLELRRLRSTLAKHLLDEVSLEPNRD